MPGVANLESFGFHLFSFQSGALDHLAIAPTFYPTVLLRYKKMIQPILSLVIRSNRSPLNYILSFRSVPSLEGKKKENEVSGKLLKGFS